MTVMTNKPEVHPKMKPQFDNKSTQITESLEYGDLKRVVKPTIHIDEFKSKMGDDDEISVFSFKVMGRDPANDLVNFIEKGYSWVLDADTSSGEMEDGDYIVFVEIERTGKLPSQVMELVSDLTNLTLNEIEDWKFLYHKNDDYQDLTWENLRNSIPLSRHQYREKYSNEPVKEMRIAAGLPVDSDYQRTPQLDQLQVWAGIK